MLKSSLDAVFGRRGSAVVGTAMAAACGAVVGCTFVNRPALAQCSPDVWRLSWSDEFSGTALNLNNWSYEVGRWPYNEELENYQISAVTVANGTLDIKATRNTNYNPPYVSGRIRTQGHFMQKFGRFEVRAKLPKGRGIWPAIWTLPDNMWPPEIDIMELLGHEPNKVYFTNHWGVYPNVSNQSSSFTGPDFSADYHVFSCDWFPDRIDFYVDGVFRKTNRNPGIPQVPMYVILNLAVGGQWPGNPDATTVFPQSMLVDYVRVYEQLAPTQQLLNPSFEDLGPNGATQNYLWTKTGNAYTFNGNARSGSRSGKLYGNFTGSPNTSRVYQEFAVVPGDVYAGATYYYNLPSDHMQGANTCSMVIEWRTGANAVISRKSVLLLNSSSEQNVYKRITSYDTAPANAAKARFLIEFSQPGMAAGAAFFDDLVFGKITCPVCPADFNQDGGIDGADVESFFVAWESGGVDADVNGDGGVDGGDVQSFFVVWQAGSC